MRDVRNEGRPRLRQLHLSGSRSQRDDDPKHKGRQHGQHQKAASTDIRARQRRDCRVSVAHIEEPPRKHRRESKTQFVVPTGGIGRVQRPVIQFVEHRHSHIRSVGG